MMVAAAAYSAGRLPTFAAHTSAKTSENSALAAIPLHLDSDGLIVQADRDGGDTAQRMGWFWFGIYVREKILGIPWLGDRPTTLEIAVALLEDGKSGRFRRHPQQEKWRETQRFSRDQQTPMIAALGMYGITAPIERMLSAMSPCSYMPPLRCIQGTKDVSDPDHDNLIRRALKTDPECLGDIWLAGGAVTHLINAAVNKNDVGGDLNLSVRLAMSALRSPTTMSREAISVYSKNRSVSSGCYIIQYRAAYPNDYSADERTMVQRIESGIRQHGWLPECPRVLGAYRWYFRTESGGNPALAELYAPLVERYLS
jgi:hypothetical protein